MSHFSEKSYRRSLRLPNYDYSQSGAYFITICIHNRECLLGTIDNSTMILNQFGEIVNNIWKSLENKYPRITLDEFVIMPNHIHGILVIENSGEAITDPNLVGAIHELPLHKKRRKMLLPKAIGYFKMNAAKRINQIRNIQGQPVWQKNYYEHIIRNEFALEKIREYIVNNPRKWNEDIENLNVEPSKEEIQFWQGLGRKL
ncbi:MAG: transposase [Xenococcaceae cyanobacterium]